MSTVVHPFLRRHLGTVIVTGIVVVCAVATYLSTHSDSKAESSNYQQVVLGGDYYLSVPIVEIATHPEKDSAWDSVDGSAPDPYYEIHWRGKRVFQSTTKSDTFIGAWSTALIDLKSLAQRMGKASLDEVIQAARITIVSGEKVEIYVFDSDPLGKDDLVGKVVFSTAQLNLGDETYLIDERLRRIVVRVQSMSETPDLLK